MDMSCYKMIDDIQVKKTMHMNGSVSQSANQSFLCRIMNVAVIFHMSTKKLMNVDQACSTSSCELTVEITTQYNKYNKRANGYGFYTIHCAKHFCDSDLASGVCNRRFWRGQSLSQ